MNSTRSLGRLSRLVLAGAWFAMQLQGAELSRRTLPGHVPEVVHALTPMGRLPATNQLALAIGLPLRNQAALDELLGQLYDARSTNFHKFLTPPEFTARFGPTEPDYQKVIRFAERHGLAVVNTHPNRLVLDVAGSVSNFERAFQVSLRVYRDPNRARTFYAPDTEPSVPDDLPVADMWGLSDYYQPIPLAHPVDPVRIAPRSYNGSGPGGTYQGRDFRNAYAAGTGLSGAGQTAAVAEFDGYYTNDIAAYLASCGYTNVPLQNILLDGVSGKPGYSGVANAVAEVSLDIELLVAMAPGLSRLMVYEGSNPYDVFNRIATDNLARQISCSWAWGVGPSHNWGHPGTRTLDSQLQQMAAQGQSFFQASGDSDAYTGSQALSSSSGPIPVDSIYVTSVGGTTLSMSGSGTSWSSETVWNWGNNTGSGGGVSPNYPIPWWQTNVSMALNAGSTVNRNIPDVALTADQVHVVYNNGSSGTFGGTSCAAPLWAGFCALVNQQLTASGSPPAGFLNPALYAIGAGNDYAACFHDTTTGNNIGNNTPGLYYATAGYDLATGWGTPNGTNLINALAPPTLPYFVTQPSSRTVTNGNDAAFNVSVGGQAPIHYRWLFNGTNLPAGGNVSGTTSNVLTISAVTTANAGDYRVAATNSYGAVTSSVATLTVVFPPSFTAQPVAQTILTGSNAVFSAMVSGAPPLIYQWQKNGAGLVNGGNVSGATSNVLTLASVTTNDAGNYALAVTNIYGSATSSVVALTVAEPPIVTAPLLAQTVQCGGTAAFSVTAAGTPPLSFQWSLDSLPLAGATNSSLTLTNVHLPDHQVVVAVTNLYGGTTDSVTLAVQDTLAPAITLNGGNPLYVELGGAFLDPGATAADLCAGPVPVAASGTVNTNAVGTNTVTYTASDGNGNTNAAVRTVIVRDTTPPTILFSFTNLALVAGSNCDATMPDVTGTNFIQAADLSGPLTVFQNPTNHAALPVGTNAVVIGVADAYDNVAYSTNAVVVLDQAPPVIFAEPQNQTNIVGGTATFSLAATACTTLAYRWFFNDGMLTNATSSTLTLSNLTTAAAGNYFAVATADGGSATSLVATLTVNLRPTFVALTSSANPAGYRDSLFFNAAATPTNAAGTVQFFTNGTAFDLETLAGGQASSTNLASLSRGTNLIMAVYSGDVNDLPSTNTLAQIVTNHPPTAVDVFYSRAAGAPLNLALTNLAASWNDADGDPVSLAAIGVSTNGVTVTNSAGTLVYFDTNNVADQFVCTIADGWGGTNFQTVNISIFQADFISVIGETNGSVTLTFTGAVESTYILQATTNLALPGWQSIATNTPGTNGPWQFNDPQATNFPLRFYRLQVGP